MDIEVSWQEHHGKHPHQRFWGSYHINKSPIRKNIFLCYDSTSSTWNQLNWDVEISSPFEYVFVKHICILKGALPQVIREI